MEIPVKTKDCIMMRHGIAPRPRRSICPSIFMFRVRRICLPIPVIPWDIIISTWWAILLPTFITIPEFVPLSVENTLHVPYSLLAKIEANKKSAY
jgi:hypothetical protein